MFGVIMAGGVGTRFWPKSREATPKQFLSFSNSQSLLQSTIRRLSPFIGWDHLYIVGNIQHHALLQANRVHVPPDHILLEPVGKNTAPCLGLAALYVQERDKSGVIVATPADHLVRKRELFKKAILAGQKIAKEKQGLVTIGIRPTRPATGYGYIQIGDALSEEFGAKSYHVKTFAEKPNLETAQRFLASGDFFWNSGIFVFRADVFMEALSHFLPDLYDGLIEIRRYLFKPQYEEVLSKIYRQIKSVPIDTGIMEKSNNVYMIRGEFTWNDLGSWAQIYEVSKKDEEGNAVAGEAVVVQSKNIYIENSDGIVAVVGLNDVVVIHEKDAVLVCAKDQSEHVKEVVEKLRRMKKTQYL